MRDPAYSPCGSRGASKQRLLRPDWKWVSRFNPKFADFAEPDHFDDRRQQTIQEKVPFRDPQRPGQV